MMQAGTQQGFTLIELMIVIVIIGILTSVALPAYKDYVVRARAAELLVVADAARMEVTEYMTLSGKPPGEDFTVQQASSAMVDSVLWEEGKLVVRGNAANLGAPVTLALTPGRNNTGTIEWSCAPVEGARYLPATCQE